ncbi:hypothetical protein AAFG07_34645 [Bradyrhizobium sp. B097]|uniref:hypothetical protein n=1 Tax=Bradyrhizobium sp. B097 TaxID=3140244 RepID=UPI003182E5AB
MDRRTFAMDMPVSQKVAGRCRLRIPSKPLRRENGIAPFSTSGDEDCADAPQRTLGQQGCVEFVTKSGEIHPEVCRPIDLVLVARSELESRSKLGEVIVWIDERPRLSRQVADEQIAIACILLQLMPWVQEKRKMTDRNMAGFLVEAHHKKISVGPFRVVSTREAPEQ